MNNWINLDNMCGSDRGKRVDRITLFPMHQKQSQTTGDCLRGGDSKIYWIFVAQPHPWGILEKHHAKVDDLTFKGRLDEYLFIMLLIILMLQPSHHKIGFAKRIVGMSPPMHPNHGHILRPRMSRTVSGDRLTSPAASSL